MKQTCQLGLGLIGIGKPWGYAPRPVPSDAEAAALLEFAFELGIRYFDTAPSYGECAFHSCANGVSEERLGRFLRSLSPEQRRELTAATKMGEHWDRAGGAPYADHSLDALRRSLDRSVERMGAIDVLQLHKTTPQALVSEDVARAWEYARSLGIDRLGPSVSDPESARIALESTDLSVIQLPFNRENVTFEPVVKAASARGQWIAVNRPFAMGAMVHRGVDKQEAFRFILDQDFTGVILTGTTSCDHLRENVLAFQNA